MKFRRFLVLILTVLIVFSVILSGCGNKLSNEQIKYDDSPITMYVGLGNSGTNYYNELKEAIFNELGYDIKLVTNSDVMDTSTAVLNQIINNDLPADIVITASRTPEQYQKEAFVDLAAVSTISDAFTSSELDRFSVGSSVYQIPLSSRLIGIEYNKTLMDEMGWSVPSTFEEMVNLKASAEEAGIKFAVSGGVATGHGFNYLFHIMGADYLSTIHGANWYSKFLDGNTSVENFEEASDYFSRYVDAGLFGSFHDTDWNASSEFSKERAIFYYNIINDISSYDGFQYTHDGRIVGAEYDEFGNIAATKDADGNAVLIDDQYVLYDENSEDMKDLDRYSIPGAVVLHDEYASMPWISEDGTSNLFTIYNNMYLALDKKLLEENQSHRLEAALKILEFMTTDKVTSIFTKYYSDGYVPVKSFKYDESRMYAKYADDISMGYTQPWYYNDFDIDTIVNTGGLVNSFIKGDENVDISVIASELEESYYSYVNQTIESTAKITNNMDYSQSASVIAVAGTYSLNKSLKASGINEKISISIVPYTTQLSDIPVTKNHFGVVQTKFYAGSFYPSQVRTYIANGYNTVNAIHMTGTEINRLLDAGYNIKKDFGIDKSFPYLSVFSGESDIDADKTYLVCVAPGSLDSETYNMLLENGNVITDGDKPVEGTVEEGLQMYALQNKEINPNNLIWN